MNDNDGLKEHGRHHTHRRSATASTWGKTLAAAGIGTVAGVIAVATYSVVQQSESPAVGTAVSQSAPNVAQSAPVPAANSHTVTQTGRVTEISAYSVTAQSSDGYTQTYRIAPDTTAVTMPAGGNASLSEQFAVDQVVTIVATISGGTATATAMADQAAAGSAGPPQDYALP